ncbi:OmpA family protein [Streptomonospora algeriensis]|uniref:OmpA family protein n=1 Tax=Streptomonospora algeriensis TaxID=995084 RepID=A0ABW3BCQ3_9ACTN
MASTKTSSTEAGTKFRIDIHSLKRQENDTIVLRFSMVNAGAEGSVTVLRPPRHGDAAADLQPFSLIDGINQKKHLPLLYSSGQCYCSDWTTNSLAAGENVTGWIAFPSPPNDAESMIFTSSITPPILDVPITGDEGKTLHPTSGELDPPKVWDVHSLENNPSENTTRQETGDEVAVSLSTDVLFAVGKSTLDTKAEGKLDQVANEIDASSSDSVEVEGHTDSSGNDSINDPLSINRAATVEDALSTLVTRPEIQFDSTGHGSSQPIATNETEEGRQKNRRVTITFAK